MTKLLKALLKLVCPHRAVRVIRYHASCVPEAWKPKLLYIDRHDVHNFVQCTCCGHILNTDQRETLADAKKDIEA